MCGSGSFIVIKIKIFLFLFRDAQIAWLVKMPLQSVFERGAFFMIKGLSHTVAVAVFVFESSAFSSENDVPAVEGKDGKYTVHHVLRAARGMRAFVPQHLVEFEVKKENPDAPDVSIGKVRVDYDSSQNLKGSTQLSFGTFTRAGEYSYVLGEK